MADYGRNREAEMIENSEGRYVYCIAEAGERQSLASIGIDGNEVYTIPANELCAVVHSCPAEPYSSDDEELVRRWVVNHQAVVEAALSRFGTVLPMRFDTIIQDKDGIDADDNVRRWLVDEGDQLKKKLDHLREKEEYGVQIFWDPKTIAAMLSRTNPEIGKLEEEIKSKPKGLAYMYRQRLEKLLKEEVEKEAERCFRDFYHRIKGCVAEVKVEMTKRAEDKQMLMNLSCLVSKGGTKPLVDELEKIDDKDGFFVRFTGPWPPYSFVTVK